MTVQCIEKYTRSGKLSTCMYQIFCSLNYLHSSTAALRIFETLESSFCVTIITLKLIVIELTNCKRDRANIMNISVSPQSLLTGLT